MAEAMQVRRVLDEKGSHIEPPMQEDWSNLQKLQWWAAATTVDGGVLITVSPAGMWSGGVQHEAFSVQCGDSQVNIVTSYDRGWYLINGIRMGIAAMREGKWSFDG